MSHIAVLTHIPLITGKVKILKYLSGWWSFLKCPLPIFLSKLLFYIKTGNTFWVTVILSFLDTCLVWIQGKCTNYRMLRVWSLHCSGKKGKTCLVIEMLLSIHFPQLQRIISIPCFQPFLFSLEEYKLNSARVS